MCNILRYKRGQRRAARTQELSVTRSCHQEPSLSRGAVTMSTKFEMTNLDMKEGASLKLKGKIHENSDGFIINLGQEAGTLCMHFNPRFKESTIVCNSKDGGKWGKEQRESHLGFGPGSEVKFTVTFEGDKFKVKLPDGHEVIFPNRLGHSQLNYLAVHGGLRVSSIKFE